VEGPRPWEAMAAALAVRWDLIFFTGSPALGRVVAQAAAQRPAPGASTPPPHSGQGGDGGWGGGGWVRPDPGPPKCLTI